MNLTTVVGIVIEEVLLAMAPYMMMYARVPVSPFTTKTRAAGDTVGARLLKQMGSTNNGSNKKQLESGFRIRKETERSVDALRPLLRLAYARVLE